MARVLVVEDEDLVRGLITKQLEVSGFEAVGAGGGREALEILKRENFDVVVLDLLMPEVNGFEVLMEIRMVMKSAVPVVILTNNDAPEHRKRCEELGVQEFLIKSDIALKTLPEVLKRVVQ